MRHITAQHREIALSIEQGIAKFTLNKPATHNALTLDMLRALDEGLARLEGLTEIRCILFCSASERFFCSGADIKEWGDIDPAEMCSRFIRAGNRVFRRIREMDIPTLSVLSDHALGGGLELALACDFRYAAEGIKLGLPEATLGVIPGWMGAQRLCALVVGKRLMRMIEPPAMDIAHQFAASVCKGTADTREGVAAFREKRPTDYRSVRDNAALPHRHPAG